MKKTRLTHLTDILILSGIIFLLLLINKSFGENSFVPDTKKKVEKLAMAIYKAEGGEKTNYPFGIKSVSCDGYFECKRICKNTIRNNISRWKKSVKKGDERNYLTFLWHRYCPPKAHKLNNSWLKNVKYYLKKK